MITTLETVRLEDLPIDYDGDLILFIDPRDKKLKQLYINHKEIWLRGFRAAENMEEMHLEEAVDKNTGECVNKKADMVEVVRCKNCIHNGNAEKCVLAAIAAEKDWPLFMLDNCGEWFCGDGKRV